VKHGVRCHIDHLDCLGQPAAHEVRDSESGDERRELLPGRAADRQGSLGMCDRLVIAVQIELPGREIGGGVDAAGELVVGHGLDERNRLLASGLGLCGESAPRAGEREDRGGGRRQRPVTEWPRRRQCTRGRVAHGLEVRAEQAVERQHDHQLDRLGCGGVRDSVQSGHDAGTGLLVAAEHVLDAGASDGEADAHREQLVRHEPDALDEVRAAVLEPSRGTEGLGARQQQLDALRGRSAVGQQAQRGADHRAALAGARSAAACPASRRDRERGDVAVAGGVLDMVRPSRRGGAALGKRVPAALMRAEEQPPGAPS
jgi:hypothetical protein